jgi:threonine dehydratase
MDLVAAPSRDQISATAALLQPYVRRTPVVELKGGDFGIRDVPIALKLESLQHSGSFKARGAFANLLLRQVPAAGIGAASGGNHGAAVAFAAMRLGHPATIFVPRISSQAKIDRIRAYGAELVVTGDSYADALQASEEWMRSSGAMHVHAFDQVETLLGTGTVGLELEQQLGAFDTVLVPVGGGGLIGGIAAWFGASINVVGVEPEAAPTLARALEAGQPVDAEAGGIAADSLAPRRVGDIVFPVAQRFVRSVVLVSDDAIVSAQEGLWSGLRVAVEPGGAAAFAALLSRRYEPREGERVCVVVSGGNTTAVDFTVRSRV